MIRGIDLRNMTGISDPQGLLSGLPMSLLVHREDIEGWDVPTLTLTITVSLMIVPQRTLSAHVLTAQLFHS